MDNIQLQQKAMYTAQFELMVGRTGFNNEALEDAYFQGLAHCMWVQLSYEDAERWEMEPGRTKQRRSGSNTKGMVKKAKVRPIVDSDSKAEEENAVY